MTTAIVRILDNHGVNVHIRDGRILAESIGRQYLADGRRMVADHWIDATDWTMIDLSRWLGY